MIMIDSKLYGKSHNWKIGQFEVFTQSGYFTVPDNGVYEILGMNCGADGGDGYGDAAEGKSKRGGGGGGSSGEILTKTLTEGSLCNVYVGTKNGKLSYFDGEYFTILGGADGGNANVLMVGKGGKGYGSLGHNGMTGMSGSSSGVIYGGDGGAGYVYEGVEYGKGGQGGSYGNDTPGKGTDGIVIVTLVSYL